MENKELDSIKRIKCYYKLEIQQNYHGKLEAYLPILSKIAEFLQTNILTRKRFINNKEYSSYTVITSSNATNSLVDNYFKDYPMFSSKQLNYLEWSKVFNLILNKKHLLRKGALICLESKNNMNKNRKTWNWDHLDQFYKL
jgi:LAGLIDADG endonuclease